MRPCVAGMAGNRAHAPCRMEMSTADMGCRCIGRERGRGGGRSQSRERHPRGPIPLYNSAQTGLELSWMRCRSDEDFMPNPQDRFVARSPALWRWRLAGCSEAPQQAAAPPPPTVTVARADPAHRRRPGRIRRPLYARSIRSRCARGYRATWIRCISPTARWSSRAISCSPSTSGRSRTRSTRRAPISCWRKSNLTFTEADLARGEKLVRDKTITEQVSSSARRPSATPRPR